MGNNDFVYCPLVNEKIQNIECITNTSCVDDMLNISNMPEKFRQKEDYKAVCQNCKWHNY